MNGSVLHPLVSICIPTCNGERYLEEALRSAFAQTYPWLEIIISDDGSNDGTLSIIERLKREAPMPLTMHHHKPAGIGANWNHCVQQATGTYIKFLFQDDLITPDCVQRMVDLALTDDEVGLVYCRRRILFDAADDAQRAWAQRYGILHRSWKGITVEEGILDGRRYLGDANLMQHPFNKIGEPTAVLLKRECFTREGLFDTRLAQSLDYVFWYKVMRHARVGFVDAELATFRLHAGQATQRNATGSGLIDGKLRQRLYLDLYREFLHPEVRNELESALKQERSPIKGLLNSFRRIFAR